LSFSLACAFILAPACHKLANLLAGIAKTGVVGTTVFNSSANLESIYFISIVSQLANCAN